MPACGRKSSKHSKYSCVTPGPPSIGIVRAPPVFTSLESAAFFDAARAGTDRVAAKSAAAFEARKSRRVTGIGNLRRFRGRFPDYLRPALQRLEELEVTLVRLRELEAEAHRRRALDGRRSPTHADHRARELQDDPPGQVES